MDALAHRRRLHAEHVRDFSRGELFQVTQHKRTAIEVGQSIEGLTVDAVSGSSLTPEGFNAALAEIAADAQA